MPSERFLSQMKKLQAKVYDQRNQGGNEALGAAFLGSHLLLLGTKLFPGSQPLP